MTANVPHTGSFDIVPRSGIRLPKTRADWQNLLHVLVLGAVPLLVLAHLGSASNWELWTAAFLALVDASLSWSNSLDATRRLVYAVGGFVQTVLLALSVTLIRNVEIVPIIGAAMAYLNAALAQLYTPTSTLKIVSGPLPPIE